MNWLQRQWYRPPAPGLAVLGAPFLGVVRLRRELYRRRWRRVYRLPVTVIIVGNITVGGTGKTPLVIALAQLLRTVGYQPGIVSRGYGGVVRRPFMVAAASDPWLVGDEALLLVRHSNCPVVVAPDRVAAIRCLLANHDCNVVLCDDGLQHYRLHRDLEIAVTDARGVGNGCGLPVGPLREPPSRLAEVDLLVGNGIDVSGGRFDLFVDEAYRLGDRRQRLGVAAFQGTGVHAVAGIGDPERFFSALRGQGLALLEHPFADHHPYAPGDLRFDDDYPVLMTEKDAVKCERFAVANGWVVPVRTVLGEGLQQHFLDRVARLDSH